MTREVIVSNITPVASGTFIHILLMNRTLQNGDSLLTSSRREPNMALNLTNLAIKAFISLDK